MAVGGERWAVKTGDECRVSGLVGSAAGGLCWGEERVSRRGAKTRREFLTTEGTEARRIPLRQGFGGQGEVGERRVEGGRLNG